MNCLTNLCNELSILKVLKPIIMFYNFLGLFVINISSTPFKTSYFSVISLALNLAIGTYFLVLYSIRKFNDVKVSAVFEVGVLLVLYVGIVSSLLVVALNFITRNFQKRLLRALIKFDAIAEKMFDLQHRQQLLILSVFWIGKNTFLLIKLFYALKLSLSSFLLYAYYTISLYIASDLAVLVLFLAAHRFTRLRFHIENLYKEKNLLIKSQRKHILILIVQTFDIVDLISKSFGIQVMIFFVTSLIVGMYTILTGFDIIFMRATFISITMFDTYKYYAIYNHLLFIVICVLSRKIVYEVSNLNQSEFS